MEKATDTGHVAHKKTHKLIYREILLEKATDTGRYITINLEELYLQVLPLSTTRREKVDSVRSRVVTGYQSKSLKSSAQYVQD